MLKISVPSCFGQPPIIGKLQVTEITAWRLQPATCFGEGDILQMPSVGSSQMSSRYMFKDARTMNRTGSCRGSFLPQREGNQLLHPQPDARGRQADAEQAAPQRGNLEAHLSFSAKSTAFSGEGSPEHRHLEIWGGKE